MSASCFSLILNWIISKKYFLLYLSHFFHSLLFIPFYSAILVCCLFFSCVIPFVLFVNHSIFFFTLSFSLFTPSFSFSLLSTRPSSPFASSQNPELPCRWFEPQESSERGGLQQQAHERASKREKIEKRKRKKESSEQGGLQQQDGEMRSKREK